jgi:putative ABC transport system permease protein
MGIITRAFRNLSRRKTRAALIVVALSFCMAILIAIPPGIAANQNATNTLTNTLGNTIAQTAATVNNSSTQIQCSLTQSDTTGLGVSSGSGAGGAAPGGGSQYGGGAFGGGSLKPMNESSYSDVNTSLSGVAAVEPILRVVEGHNETITPRYGASTQSFNVTVPDYIITGVPLNASLIDKYSILPTNITQGKNLKPNETGAVVLSENSSAYFHAGVGATVNILGTNFTVSGIYAPTSTSNNQSVYMNLADAQALTNNTNVITSFNVFATSTDTVTSVAKTIQSMHPELDVTTPQDTLNQLQQMQSSYGDRLNSTTALMDQTQMQAIEEIVIAFAATGIIVLFVMLYTVRERTREIGTLKAIGASDAAIMGQFLLEGILLSVLAGIVGVLIGTIGAPYLSGLLLPAVGNSLGGYGFAAAGGSAATSAVTVSPELMLLGFSAAVVLGAIGSLYPAWRAARTRPAEAMRYE